MLYENGGITYEIRQAFVVYLANSSRPINEMLNPNLLDIETTFTNELSGMTMQAIAPDELLKTRQRLIFNIRNGLKNTEKDFSLSMKVGEPKWDLMPFDNLDRLLVLQWKLINVQRMDGVKRKIAVKKLSDLLMQ